MSDEKRGEDIDGISCTAQLAEVVSELTGSCTIGTVVGSVSVGTFRMHTSGLAVGNEEGTASSLVTSELQGCWENLDADKEGIE